MGVQSAEINRRHNSGKVKKIKPENCANKELQWFPKHETLHKQYCCCFFSDSLMAYFTQRTPPKMSVASPGLRISGSNSESEFAITNVRKAFLLHHSGA